MIGLHFQLAMLREHLFLSLVFTHLLRILSAINPLMLNKLDQRKVDYYY